MTEGGRGKEVNEEGEGREGNSELNDTIKLIASHKHHFFPLLFPFPPSLSFPFLTHPYTSPLS